MKLAPFDLDRTLLPIDSAGDGSHLVVRAGGFDAARCSARIREFADTYAAGRFDALARPDFQMGLPTRLARAAGLCSNRSRVRRKR